MDKRFTQLHADVLGTIKGAGPNGLVRDAVQVRIDQRYRPAKLLPDAPFTVPLGQILEHLMLDNGFIEPFDSVKQVRDVTSGKMRITPSGVQALEYWTNLPDEQKVADSIPRGFKGEIDGEPLLPTDSPLRALLGKAQKAVEKDAGIEPAAPRPRPAPRKGAAGRKVQAKRGGAKGARGKPSKPTAPKPAPAPAAGRVPAKAGALPRRK